MGQGGTDLQKEAFQKARDRLMGGWNCCQSVLLTMQELLQRSGPDLLRAATGFGGGIGNMGAVCGALAAGVMTLGLLYGRDDLSQKERKEHTYRLCAEYYRWFVRAMGSCDCYDIIKVDLKNLSAREAYWKNSENRERCATRTVGKAARLLMQLIEETEAGAAASGRLQERG